MDDSIIQTNNLTRAYKSHTAVNQLNMVVRKGSIYGFLGPNGAGKTTTIRMLLGLIRPTAGTIQVFGQDLKQHRLQILRRVGSLVESPSYYGHLSGKENLTVYAKILGVSERRIDEVLDIVRLTSPANRAVKGYSLGMKQRLGIATALLGAPELLILDEPTNGLDPAGIHEMRELILRLPQQFGMTVLLSSHLLSEIDQMASEVGVIHKGNLVFQDRIDVLRQQNAPRLLLEVDQPGLTHSIVSRAGHDSGIEGQTVVLPGLDFPATAAIVRDLVQAGISVFRIWEQRPSLEDIFLNLVGKEASL